MKSKTYIYYLTILISIFMAKAVFGQSHMSDYYSIPMGKGKIVCPMMGYDNAAIEDTISYKPMPKNYGMMKHHNTMLAPGMGILQMSKELELTQEQQDKIFNAILQTRQKNNSLKLELLKIRYEIFKEESKPQPDIKKIKDLNSQIAKISSEIRLNNMNLRTDIMGILTPNQIEKLKSLRRPK
ncbi:MAG: Spy/CpxP family protein refolding chaperone [Brevinematia bacterium]